MNDARIPAIVHLRNAPGNVLVEIEGSALLRGAPREIQTQLVNSSSSRGCLCSLVNGADNSVMPQSTICKTMISNPDVDGGAYYFDNVSPPRNWVRRADETDRRCPRRQLWSVFEYALRGMSRSFHCCSKVFGYVALTETISC